MHMAKPWQLPTTETHGREPTEYEEQIDFIRWFRRSFPGTLIFHIPNGEKRTKRDGARLKVAGVVPGVPDLFVPAWGLWLEMKAATGGQLSPEQREIIVQLESSGHTVRVCHGSSAAKDAVFAFTRGRLERTTGTELTR